MFYWGFAWGLWENVQGEMIRVRVDLADARTMADVSVESSLPVAALIPELVALFPEDAVASATERGSASRAFPTWRIRLTDGTVADYESSLSSIGVLDGDRLTLVDDPGPIPAPRVIDIADALSDETPGIAIADRTIGAVLALTSSVLAGIALVQLSSTDYVLASASAFLCALLASAGLRIAINMGNSPIAARVFTLQLLGFSAVTGFSFVGAPLASALIDWRAISGVVLGLAVPGVILTYFGRSLHRFPALLFLGTAGWSTAAILACYACVLYFLDVQSAVALTAVTCIISIMIAPAGSVALAGIRIPHIPAAGESFDDSDDPNSEPHTALALRSSLLLDGTLLGVLTVLAVLGSTLVVMDFAEDSSWALAMSVCIALITAVQSRGHARFVPSLASALVAGTILLTICWQQWTSGIWVTAIAIALPLFAAVALPAIPSTRISPTARRALEFIEAIAIAVSLPLAAIIVDLPEIVQGVMQ